MNGPFVLFTPDRIDEMKLHQSEDSGDSSLIMRRCHQGYVYRSEMILIGQVCFPWIHFWHDLMMRFVFHADRTTTQNGFKEEVLYTVLTKPCWRWSAVHRPRAGPWYINVIHLVLVWWQRLWCVQQYKCVCVWNKQGRDCVVDILLTIFSTLYVIHPLALISFIADLRSVLSLDSSQCYS